MKIDTLENWSNSSLKLKKGELAFATVAASAGTGLAEPVVMVKIGTEEEKTFAELPWSFYAKASDVVEAAKSEAGLTAFVNNVIANAGIATDEAMTALTGRVTTAEGEIDALQAELDTAETGLKARVTTAEGAIDALEALVGDTAVATQIANAITELNLANTYEAKGEAAKVQTALETYKTTNDAAVLANTNNISANTNAITAIKDGTTIDSFADVESALAGKETAGAAAAAETAAKTYADGLNTAMDTRVQAVEGKAHTHTFVETELNKIADGDVAKWNAAEQNAKDYTDSEIERVTGGKTVAETLESYTNTEGMNSAIAAAKGEAVSHADGLNTAMNTRVEALEAIDHTHTFVESELNLIQTGDVAKWNAAEQNAKDYADGLDEVMDGRVAALEAKFGDGEGNVEAQIAAAVAAEKERAEGVESGLDGRLTTAEGDINTLEGKVSTLEGEMDQAQADIDALELLVGDTAVATQISTAVAAEKTRAEGIEAGLESRLAAVEGDYLKAADKTELEGKITANSNAIELLTNGVSAEEVDGVNDLIQYVKDHGTEVTGMKADIKANADAIDAIEADYLKAADKTALQEQITANDGEIADLQTAVGTKAAQADLEALAGRVTTAEGKVTTLEGEMDAVEGRATALETKVGDETVAAQIESAIEALNIGNYALAADLTAEINRAKAAEEANATAAAAAQSAADKAQGEVDALEETVAGLHTIATTGNVNDLVQTAGDVLVFDCGTSAV